MVGHHFLEQCVSRNLHQQFRIVVFGEERYAAYDRVHLSEYFAGRSAESLSLVDGDFFARHGIELRLSRRLRPLTAKRGWYAIPAGMKPTGINWCWRPAHIPSFRRCRATISRAVCLPHLDDLDRIAACAGRAKRGVVIGGGLLGLEAANALKQLGLETHVVEFAPNLMAVQLDNGAPRCCGRKSMILASVCTPARRPEYRARDDGLVLNFADGESLATDMVVFSAGIRPQDTRARSGLTVGERGGIVIDNQCRTSDPQVLAIGECALWQDKIYGLVAPGYQMARTAAAMLAGEEASFSGADMSTKLKLLGIDVASFGDAQGRTPGSQSYQWTDGPGQIYKKIVVCQEAKRCWAACWWAMPAITPRCCK
jgi:nitrite reductase (NADH) large subunit